LQDRELLLPFSPGEKGRRRMRGKQKFTLYKFGMHPTKN